MIDIPPGSSPSTPAASSLTASRGDAAATPALLKLEAVVQRVQAAPAEGEESAASGKHWDIVLRLNPQASGTPIKADALTPEVMRALQTGQPVLLQTQASQPLAMDSRLQVTVTPSQGVQIQTITLPPAQAPSLAHLNQFVHLQQSLAPLLTNLVHLPENQLAALPAQVQTTIAQLVAALPEPQAVREQLQQWMANSGLLQEAKLAQWLKNATTGLAPTSASAESGVDRLAMTGAPSTLQQVRQQVQALVQRLLPATPEAAVQPASASAPPRDLNALLAGDLKHALQQLERQLAQVAGDKGTPGSPSPATAADGDAVDLILKQVGELKPGARLREGTTLPGTATLPRSLLAIQRYQASAASKPAADIPELMPPLPGQVVVQAQPRARPSVKDGDLADALVRTLLAQVRGALARVTLHQLSSHSQRQDSATPTSLSFEIPFLHQQQIEVFQFRIDEETPPQDNAGGKPLAKRWVVQMGFDIDGLGPMFCQLSLTGNAMAVQFWAAWEQTLNSTRAHFGFLEKSLQDMGIRVEKIQAQLGMPEIDRTGVRNQLVDVKT